MKSIAATDLWRSTMREAELLKALSVGDKGIQVTMDTNGVNILPRYLPSATTTSTSLMSAALQCARKIVLHGKNDPSLKQVLQALTEYDNHSIVMQI
jgi:hypothetical protein